VSEGQSLAVKRDGADPVAACRSCGQPLSHVFVDLGATPLANSYLSAAELRAPEVFYPLVVYVCAGCFLVQLEEYERPEAIFREYAYFSSYSDTWLRHAEAYCEQVAGRFALDARTQVVEIASNDGYLLQYFRRRGIPVLGVEPAANVARVAVERGIPTEVRFFGEATARELVQRGICPRLLLGNNVLAHVPALNDFVAGMKLLLAPDGVITMEFPHLARLMAENQFDTIYHEHFSYFSLLAVERVFARHGLVLFDVEELPTHGGSLRIYARHVERGSVPVGERVHALRRAEEAAGFGRLEHYLAFAERVKRTKWALLDFLVGARREGRTVAAYGAAAKGNTLLNYCGAGPDLIDYVVDRSPHKQGRFLPGTRIPIVHPDRLAETRPDFVLILPWNIKEEIMEQMAHVRRWGGRFVVPIPEVAIQG
jgi:SAM-dependent methyltransferase